MKFVWTAANEQKPDFCSSFLNDLKDMRQLIVFKSRYNQE
jgi:hypothetical protein